MTMMRIPVFTLVVCATWLLPIVNSAAGGQPPVTEAQALKTLSKIHHVLKRSEPGNKVIELHIGGIFPPYVSDEYLETALAFPDLRELSLGPPDPDAVSPESYRKLSQLPHLESLTFSEYYPNDSELLAICSLKNLKSLSTVESDFTDDGFRLIGNLKKLEVLAVGYGGDMSSGTLQRIGQLTSLKILDLEMDSAHVNSSDIRYLKPLVRLEILVLRDFVPDDDDLNSLEGLTKLKRLEFDGSRMTERGLEHLRNARDLTELRITRARITGAALSHFPKLQELHLSSSTLDDSSISTLAGLKNLKKLNIRGTRITEEGYSKLKTALPDCKFYYQPQKLSAERNWGPP